MPGAYKHLRPSYAPRNSPATFQRVTQKALAGLNQFCSVYIDEIIVYSRSVDEHKVHLEKVFDRLELKLHPEKCKLGCSEVLYLGHVVSAEGILPNPEKVRAVRDFRVPTKEKSLREFLGLASYYHHFVPKFAKVAAPLYALTKNSTGHLMLSRHLFS